METNHEEHEYKVEVTVDLYEDGELVHTDKYTDKDGVYVMTLEETEHGILSHGTLQGRVHIPSMTDTMVNTLERIDDDGKGICCLLISLLKRIERKCSQAITLIQKETNKLNKIQEIQNIETQNNIKVDVQELIRQIKDEL